ncbi:DUF4276 family protein [Burkholderia cenocepacia]|uniref:DUF4276 family protein n=1 Tax=Burkholderia cenocepacia TaxID=95486 RepID=UPI000F55B85C|nr:DUF4276 family protein [Burkholderia cenocepacia]RQU70730.1 DUF4276 family protein [Burkholderia cenocepacia]RQV03905.1 DUF4276 family protein [Burkholderia cenocepacia]
MYAIIGEHQSDVDTIAQIVKRIVNDSSILVRGKGFGGCGELLKRGASQLQLYSDLKFSKFIACYDSDGGNPDEKKRELINAVFAPSGIQKDSCVALVPVHMIESWILADISAIGNVIKNWRVDEDFTNPESVRYPKKRLEDMSKIHHRPRYNHVTMNPAIAKHINIEVVFRRCPSFRPLHNFVKSGVGNLQ